MRTFFVIGHTQAGLPSGIVLNDLAGASGRWDILARCVGAALLRSHGVRQDAEIVLFLLSVNRYVRVSGDRVRHLNPDERSTAALMAKALAAEPVGPHEEPAGPGLAVGQGPLTAVLARVAAGRPVVWLDENGPAAGAWPSEAVYVLSDHQDFSDADRHALAEARATQRSLGDDVLQADHAIAIVHDRVRQAMNEK